MARKVFYSFHYDADNWRASKVRNIGVVEGNQPAKDNDWETVTKGGEAAIKKWIDSQMAGRTCTVVLIGAGTANRKWINYEILKSWELKIGLLGVYIHNILDRQNAQSAQGSNPFDHLKFQDGSTLSKYVKAYNPPFQESTKVYEYISSNISKWIEDAVASRK